MIIKTPNISAIRKHLKMCASETLLTVFLKYTLVPLYKLTGWYKHPNLFSLIKSLLRKKSFTLIVIDACRYDIFSKIYKDYVSGQLIKVVSPGPNTYEWLPKLFSLPDFDNLCFFCAHPIIKDHFIKEYEFIPSNRNVKVISMWPKEKSKIGTVLPTEVNKEIIRRGLSKRNIIWYVQPHIPWIMFPNFSEQMIKEANEKNVRPRFFIKRKIKEGELSKEEIIKAYIHNLRLVLYSISKVIKVAKKVTPIIILTSDHGEFLGEYGFFLHDPHLFLPQTCIVPWLIVK